MIWSEGVVRFVDINRFAHHHCLGVIVRFFYFIGGIVDHHCLIIIFISTWSRKSQSSVSLGMDTKTTGIDFLLQWISLPCFLQIVETLIFFIDTLIHAHVSRIWMWPFLVYCTLPINTAGVPREAGSDYLFRVPTLKVSLLQLSGVLYLFTLIFAPLSCFCHVFVFILFYIVFIDLRFFITFW